MMIMVEHDQIEGLLGDLSFATIEGGTHQALDHLDQRGAPDTGVEFLKHPGCERVKFLTKEPGGARQPALAFSVMIALGMCVRLIEEMIMVPRQYEKISDIVRHHRAEFSINRLGLLKRDDHIIDVRAHGLERCGQGSAVECFKHVKKQRECRAYVFAGAQSPMRSADMERFTQ